AALLPASPLAQGERIEVRGFDVLPRETVRTLPALSLAKAEATKLASSRARKECAQSVGGSPFCAAGLHGFGFHRIGSGHSQIELFCVFARQSLNNRICRLSAARIENLHFVRF